MNKHLIIAGLVIAHMVWTPACINHYILPKDWVFSEWYGFPLFVSAIIHEFTCAGLLIYNLTQSKIADKM